MLEDLNNSDFAPIDFELSFSVAGDMPPVTLSEGDTQLTVNGLVDRVDGMGAQRQALSACHRLQNG
jgi:ATP-dependent helicase/DNAse subunit B